MAVALLFGHGLVGGRGLAAGPVPIVAGIVAGFLIGVVASLLGVAGGELLIPTLVLLFRQDIKLAGSLSLAVSLPTMAVGFTRYSRDQSFAVVGRHKSFVILMATGSILGTLIGGMLLGVVPEQVLLPALAAILVVSAYRFGVKNRATATLLLNGSHRRVPSTPTGGKLAGAPSYSRSRMDDPCLASRCFAGLVFLSLPVRPMC